ncbi:Gfo/Idh/MocA family protein [Aeromicrobium sp. UC242_57]|uniref:Gfo/Idh/MocA family protein n=1 Tax=Aeromicrobium sp. UC242_57 TaxID=3374624 RepID=UPI0037918B1B
MTSLVRVVLVGLGGMGMRHVRAYAALRNHGVADVELAFVCDRDEGRRAAAVKLYESLTGVTLDDVADLADLATGDVDAAHLAVPTGIHRVVAESAFAAGLHVLVEKPIAITIDDARAMQSAADAAGLVLAVAENFRRVPSNRAARAMVRDGVIGRPYFSTSLLSLPAEFAHPDGGGAWFRDPAVAGSLAALEMGVHEMDLLQYWFGDIQSVQATARVLEPAVPGPAGIEPDDQTDDSCFANVSLAGGVVAQFALTMAGHGGTQASRLVVGDRGSMTSDTWEGWQGGFVTTDDGQRRPVHDHVVDWIAGLDDEERAQLLPAGTWDPDDLTISTAEPLRYGLAYEIWDFARSIIESRPPEIGGPEAMTALAGGLAILESSWAGREVSIAEILDGTVDSWQASFRDRQ